MTTNQRTEAQHKSVPKIQTLSLTNRIAHHQNDKDYVAKHIHSQKNFGSKRPVLKDPNIVQDAKLQTRRMPLRICF
jgi:hypothetical protein